MTVKVKAQIEYDNERGVIYVHAAQGMFKGGTAIRICRLPTKQKLHYRQIDIVNGHRAMVCQEITP